jgi:translation initiation factor 2 gamma subunit (eIF-2gamma)
MTELIELSITSNDKTSLGFDINSPATAPAQHRKQAVGGSLFFGFFLLAKQKKETR